MGRMPHFSRVILSWTYAKIIASGFGKRDPVAQHHSLSRCIRIAVAHLSVATFEREDTFVALIYLPQVCIIRHPAIVERSLFSFPQP